jgi:hypothetical protein
MPTTYLYETENSTIPNFWFTIRPGLETLSWPVCTFVPASPIFFYFNKMVLYAQVFLNPHAVTERVE